MTRGLRSPAVLMTMYVGLFLYAGPWLGTGSPPHRNASQALVAVLLAVLACRGSRAARVLFADARPGPKGPTKATGPVREQVLALRARQLAVTEIARILTAEGIPISAQTVWKICQAEGLARLRGDDDTPAARPAASHPSRPPRWAAGRPRQRTCAVITPGCCCWPRP